MEIGSHYKDSRIRTLKLCITCYKARDISRSDPTSPGSKVIHLRAPSSRVTCKTSNKNLELSSHQFLTQQQSPRLLRVGSYPPDINDMSFQGVDLTADAGQVSTSISWQ